MKARALVRGEIVPLSQLQFRSCCKDVAVDMRILKLGFIFTFSHFLTFLFKNVNIAGNKEVATFSVRFSNVRSENYWDKTATFRTALKINL